MEEFKCYCLAMVAASRVLLILLLFGRVDVVVVVIFVWAVLGYKIHVYEHVMLCYSPPRCRTHFKTDLFRKADCMYRTDLRV